MKLVVILLSVLCLLYTGCCYNKTPGDEYFILRLSLPHTISFSSIGYTSVKIMEYDRELDNLYLNTNHLELPIALNKSLSTYVFHGDSISDTLQIGNYVVEPFIENYCGYQIRMTEPQLTYHTFNNYNVTHHYYAQEFIFSVFLK